MTNHLRTLSEISRPYSLKLAAGSMMPIPPMNTTIQNIHIRMEDKPSPSISPKTTGAAASTPIAPRTPFFTLRSSRSPIITKTPLNNWLLSSDELTIVSYNINRKKPNWVQSINEYGLVSVGGILYMASSSDILVINITHI